MAAAAFGTCAVATPITPADINPIQSRAANKQTSLFWTNFTGCSGTYADDASLNAMFPAGVPIFSLEVPLKVKVEANYEVGRNKTSVHYAPFCMTKDDTSVELVQNRAKRDYLFISVSRVSSIKMVEEGVVTILVTVE
jgi:hypothetical protein